MLTNLFSRLSIRLKLVVVITFLLWVISIFIFFFFPAQFENQALEAIASKAHSISNMTAFGVAPAIMFDDRRAIDEVFQSAQQNEDLLYIVIVNDSGKVIYGFNQDKADQVKYMEGINALSEDQFVYKTAVGVTGGTRKIADLYLGLSLSRLKDEVGKSRALIALVSLLVFVFGVGAVIAISTIITGPLRSMAEAASAIARGDMAKRADINSKDEVGDIAGSFNQMVENLRKAYEELETVNKTLESRVSERTYEYQTEIDERRKVEQALLLSEARQRAILNAIPDMMLFRDSDGEYSPDPDFLFIPPTDEFQIEDRHEQVQNVVSRVEPLIRTAIETRTVQMMEYSVLTPIRRHHFEARIASCENDQAVVIVRDITDRKETEESLRASESRQRAILGAMPDIMFLQDADRVYLDYYAPDPSKLFVPPDKFLGRRSDDVLPFDLSLQINPLYTKALETGRMQFLEYYLEQNGKISFFEARISPSGPDHTVTIVRDITERKHAEARMHLQGAALEAAANAIVITDRNGDIVYVNPAFTELTGHQLSEVLGHSLQIQKSGVHDQVFYETLWNTIGSGSVWHGEITNKRKDGSLYVEEMTITPVLNDDGQIQYYIAIKQDITARKQIEDSLVQAKERAENADRLKDLFIGNISHQIRTPLNLIIGYINLSLAELEAVRNDSLNAYFDSIKESAKQLVRTVDLVLDISRIEAGNLEIEHASINLTAMIEAEVDDIKNAAREKNLTVSYMNDCGSVVMEGDEYYLSRVFKNLLDNAVKFTEQGFVKVRVLGDPSGSVVVEVEDSGVGISPDYCTRIFEPYAREEEHDASTFRGVGLGLALVKKYLDLHNASIDVRSVKGHGSVFAIVFDPSNVRVNEVRHQVAESVVAVTPQPVVTPKAKSTGGPPILILEDDLPTCQFMRLILKQHYTPLIANTVAEARKVLAEQEVSLILTDISLSGEEDGLTFVKELRGIEAFKVVPIIVVTAHAFPRDRDLALESGCNEFLTKPVDRNILLDLINRLLTGRG